MAVFGVEPGQQRVDVTAHLPPGADERYERSAHVEEQQRTRASPFDTIYAAAAESVHQSLHGAMIGGRSRPFCGAWCDVGTATLGSFKVSKEDA
ncbi:hypothetical protein [Micromonospora cremea]|uniref:hypothetical protein n=1 Tax=Micromonospora cremea TaxID=709881 RepID=UPI000940D339|nr:hypothetical protein [Micromonospora cremea]